MSIPSYIDPNIRNTISSHVPIVRAVFKYRESLNKPVEPTKLFRFNLINRYDIGKAGGNTFCKFIAEMVHAKTFALSLRQLLATRYFYFPLISAANLEMIAHTGFLLHNTQSGVTMLILIYTSIELMYAKDLV
jgi:hypothetical protein